jgi:hypothetical protein
VLLRIVIIRVRVASDLTRVIDSLSIASRIVVDHQVWVGARTGCLVWVTLGVTKVFHYAVTDEKRHVVDAEGCACDLLAIFADAGHRRGNASGT